MCKSYYKDYLPNFDDPEDPIVIDGCLALQYAEWECNALFEFVPRPYSEDELVAWTAAYDEEIPF